MLLYFLLNGFLYPWFFVGLTLITAISFADDVKPQSRQLRLSIQFLAMFLMFFQLGLFHMPWSFMLVALIFCTGVLNAYNFMDGINGMTGGYSMVTIGYLCYINTFEAAFVDNNLKPHRKHMYQIRTNELKIPHLVVSGGYCVVQALILKRVSVS